MEPRISVVTLGVADLARSYRFYRDGLGLPTIRRPGDGIVFFQTSGAVLALFPYDELAADIGPGWRVTRSRFTGITWRAICVSATRWTTCWPGPLGPGRRW